MSGLAWYFRKLGDSIIVESIPYAGEELSEKTKKEMESDLRFIKWYKPQGKWPNTIEVRNFIENHRSKESWESAKISSRNY